jgi:hypothetical protein
VTPLGLCRDGVGEVEDRLCRAVVLLEAHRGRVREPRRKGQDVLGAGRTEAVDRLQVVADDRQAGVVATQRLDDVD